MSNSVSVIIPHYRSVDTIARALNSIAAQTLQPCEVVVVDDASPANDFLELDALLSAFPLHIKLIRLDSNAGPGVARNAGWQAAVGSLVAFLDADDSWLPNKLLSQTQLIDDYGLDVVGGPSIKFDAPAESDSEVEVDLQTLSSRSILMRNRYATSTVILRRVLPLRFDSHRRYSEDFELWLRLSLSGARLGRHDTAMSVSYKRAFGESGLSGSTWAMSKSQLGVYHQVYRDGLISTGEWLAASAWSAARAARRIAVTFAVRARRRLVGL